MYVDIWEENKQSKTKQWYVFCYQNCSDLLWEKNVLSSYREKLLKFEAEGWELEKKNWDH